MSTISRLDGYLVLFSLMIILLAPLIHLIPEVWIVLLCAVLFFSTGLPHGALDHIIYFQIIHKRNKPSPGFMDAFIFFGFYIFIIIAFSVLWFQWPFAAFIVFMMVSSYHFGESQLAGVIERNFAGNIFIFFTWGAFVLSWFIHFHKDYAENVLLSIPGISIEPIHQFFILIPYFLVLNGGILFICAFYAFLSHPKNRLNAGRQVLYLMVIITALACLPPLLAFLCYFGLWHSLRVMVSEYELLKKTRVISGFWGFLKAILPFTILSILGIFIFSLFFAHDSVGFSPLLIFLIAISVLTLPHTFVMVAMYGFLH